MLASSLLFLGGVAVTLGGCAPKSASGPTEDSLTSGRIQVVCETEARGLMEREQSAFQALYPQAVIELRVGSSRQAISDLFGATCDLAVVGRELEPEERGAAVRGGLQLEGYRFARDAIAVIVHPLNPLENIAIDDIRGIFRGEISRWSSLGGSDQPIVPVVLPPGSGISESLIRQVLGNEPPLARAARVASDSLAVERVIEDPNAIGYVSMPWAKRGAKVLRVASLTGLPYWNPDPETVYKGDYPLTRYFNLFVRPEGAKLASGFVTFVTSRDGQDLVHRAGLVPTAVPVRFVRRSPMLGSHPTTGDRSSTP